MGVLKLKDGNNWTSIQTIKGEKGDTGERGQAGVGVPSGGTTGQILKKASSTDYDTEWGDAGSGLPSGGTQGQVLVKNSSTDGDVIWGDPAKGTLLVTFSNPTGTQSGYIADKTYAEVAQAISDGKFVYGYYDGTLYDTNYYLLPTKKTSSSVLFDHVYTEGNSTFKNKVGRVTISLGSNGVGTNNCNVFGYPNLYALDAIGINVSYDSTNDEYQYKGCFGFGGTDPSRYNVLYDKLTSSSEHRPSFATVTFGTDQDAYGMSYYKRGVFPLINTYCDNVYYEDGDYYIPELHMIFGGIGYKNGNPVIMSFDLTGQYESQIPTNRELVYTETAIGGGSLPSGGTVGQVLTKNSSTDGDADWSDPVTPTAETMAYDNTETYSSGSIGEAVKNIESDVETLKDGLTFIKYGISTWDDFITAYNNNNVVYCRASSGSNPASGSQTRLAFMAYVNSAETPTEVEFQYYRSVSSHTAQQQGDQVFVYKLNKTGGWTVTTREAYTKIVAGTGLTSTYSNGVLTISLA